MEPMIDIESQIKYHVYTTKAGIVSGCIEVPMHISNDPQYSDRVDSVLRAHKARVETCIRRGTKIQTLPRSGETMEQWKARELALSFDYAMKFVHQ